MRHRPCPPRQRTSWGAWPALPQGWQLHVMRRLDTGTTPLAALSSAALARNIGRNRFGIDGWRALSESRPPAA